MARLFNDIGKDVKDLFNKNFSYDNKVTVESNTDMGVKFTAVGAKKNEQSMGTLTGSYQVAKGCEFECGVSHDGKLTGQVEANELAPGLKATLSGSVPYANSGTMTMQYKQGIVGAKTSVGGIGPNPKLEGSICVNPKGASVGAEMGYDTGSNSVTKYNAAAQYVKGDAVVCATLADKADTMKMSYYHFSAPRTAVGAEVAHKRSKGTNTVSIGAARQLEGEQVAKATVDSAGMVCMQYSAPIESKTTVTFCTQMNAMKMDAVPKAGFQLKFKS